MNFTQLLNEYLTLFNEVPLEVENHNSVYENLNNILYNQEIAKSLKHQNTPICQITDRIKLVWDIYYTDSRYFIVANTDNFIGCSFSGKQKQDNGFQCTYVWQDIKQYQLAREIIFEFFITHFTYYESDNIHTTLGKMYWKKLIIEALQKHIKCFYVYKSQLSEITSINNFDTFYEKGVESSQFTFRLYQ